MNLSKFESAKDRFPILDLEAQFYFKTETSIAFLVGTGPVSNMTVMGRVEVHHPCYPQCKDSIRVNGTVTLPAKYLTTETMIEILKTLYQELEINQSERHQFRFFEYGPRAYVMTDWFVPAYSPT